MWGLLAWLALLAATVALGPKGSGGRHRQYGTAFAETAEIGNGAAGIGQDRILRATDLQHREWPGGMAGSGAVIPRHAQLSPNLNSSKFELNSTRKSRHCFRYVHSADSQYW